jgi:hypothetical protein
MGICGAGFWLLRHRDSAKREEELRNAGVSVGYLESDRLLSGGELAFVAVRNQQFSDASLSLLSSIRRVRAFDLSDTALTEDGLIELLNGRGDTLLHLDVSGLRLGQKGAAAIGRARAVWSLRVAHCELTDDEALEMLSPRIRFAALDNNRLTDATLRKLSGLPELVVVSFENNHISDSAIEEFRQQHEDTQILSGQEMKDFMRGKWIR